MLIAASAVDEHELCGLIHYKSITACGKLIVTALVSNSDWG
ncbi:MAG: hypothetical protein QE493_05965 [Verrucomicrobiae bacterium]|nr:hypothetical protein [Verrucomicrobiae bacterium]